MTTIPAGLVSLFLATGCGAYTPSQAAAPAYQRDVVTREEIVNSPQQSLDLLTALQSLRPNFLTVPMSGRRTSSSQTIAVYINGTRQQGTDALRSLPASSVEEVKYLDPMKAQNEFGPVASLGALLVTLHKIDRSPQG